MKVLGQIWVITRKIEGCGFSWQGLNKKVQFSRYLIGSPPSVTNHRPDAPLFPPPPLVSARGFWRDDLEPQIFVAHLGGCFLFKGRTFKWQWGNVGFFQGKDAKPCFYRRKLWITQSNFDDFGTNQLIWGWSVGWFVWFTSLNHQRFEVFWQRRM